MNEAEQAAYDSWQLRQQPGSGDICHRRADSGEDGMTIYDEIMAERQYQDRLWGGPTHDDQHTSHDWIAYIVKYAGRAVMWPWDRPVFRRQMVCIAALAVAAIEWSERMEKDA